MKYPLLTFLIALTASVSSNAQTLQIDPMYVGGTATFEVQNGSPNAAAVICYSMNGIGPFTLSNGIALDLSLPIKSLSPFALDMLGNGTQGPFPLPSNAAVGLQVWFQGVQLDMWANPIYSVTNMVPITVQVVPNNPPTAVDDSASTRESVAVTIDVIANDSDIDGDAISLFSVSTPAGGSAMINSGVIDYTPNTGFSGSDTFTYQLQDSFGDQDSATVTVTVIANNAPTAVDDSASTRESVAVTIDVIANDSDADGDAISLFSVSTPAGGSAMINGGVIDYTPNTGFSGSDTFTYQLQDSFGDQDSATVTVTVVANNAPTAVDDKVNVTENSVALVDVLANDNDADGDTMSVVSVLPPLHGTAVIANGQVEYTPFVDYLGSDSFTYVIEDAFGAQATATVIMYVFTGGSLVAWGPNWHGQVSDTPTTNDFIQVAAGLYYSVALRSDGSLVSWGRDDYSQVTDTPVGTSFIQVAAGLYHSVALRSDGSLVSWGRDDYSQVTDTPVGTSFIQVAAGSSHSVALRSDGSIVSWGRDNYSQVTDTPVGNDFTQVAAGFSSHALRSDGSLVSWGHDAALQVTDTPIGNDFTDVSAGGAHSVALRSDGSLESWGDNDHGQVSSTPTTNDFTQVAAGSSHSVALRSDGTLVSWGWGQMTGLVSDTPVGNDFTQVAAGGVHSVAIREAPSDMTAIPAGTFEMGDHSIPSMGDTDELPVHGVTLDAFYMDRYEVSNVKFADYLNNSNVSVSGATVSQVGGAVKEICYLSNGLFYDDSNSGTFFINSGKDSHPVVNQTWYGAALYCNYLSAVNGRTPCYDEMSFVCDFAADGFRLPTEAEWEYASRGDEHNPYYQYPWGIDFISHAYANYDNTANIGDTVDVGSYAANGYGLYDMAGNVWERCNDWYDNVYYDTSPSTNPTGGASGLYRVIRGGSWYDFSIYLRCADRDYSDPTAVNEGVGFRVIAVQ